MKMSSKDAASRAIEEKPGLENASKRIESLKRLVRSTKQTLSNPTVLLSGVALVATGGIAYTLIAHEPNVAGTIAGIGTSIEDFPQAIKSFRSKSTRDLSLGYLTMNASAGAGLAAYGVMLRSIPLIAADAFSFACNAVPLVIKVKETLRDIKDRSTEARKNPEIPTKNNEDRTEVARTTNTLLRRAKEKLSHPITNLSAATMPLLATCGATAYSFITNNPNVVGGYSAAVCTGIYLPQAIQSIRTRSTRDLSLQSLAITFAASLNWITYAVLIHAPAVIVTDGGLMFFGIPPFVIKIQEVLRDVKARKLSHDG